MKPYSSLFLYEERHCFGGCGGWGQEEGGQESQSAKGPRREVWGGLKIHIFTLPPRKMLCQGMWGRVSIHVLALEPTKQ